MKNNTNKIKILIAEDDIFLVDVFKVKFESKNFEVKVALDGEQVIKALKDYEPTVILLDILMPNMDGFETLKALKKNPKWRKIPVIVTTNLSQSSDQEKAMKLGADDYLVKSNTSLETIVKKILFYSKSEEA